MSTWNVFRILGDCSHLSSICILIWAIHRNRSAEGISLLTQILYALVFVTRYLDLFAPDLWGDSSWHVMWNVSFKIFYLLTSFYIVYLMMKVFPRTRERERAWKFGIWSVGGAVVLSPISILIFERGFPPHWFLELTWAFSIILESVCVLPQLILLRQTTVPTVIDSYYLLTLGSYRAFYFLNWLVRGFGSGTWDPIAFIFGIVQTAFYLDFAWVYYTRQRVKLRNGGVVDSEDFRKSWLVNRVVNFRRPQAAADEEQNLREDEEDLGSQNTNRWGARGISIAADDPLEHDRDDEDEEGVAQQQHASARVATP
ncbi:uncharacterized protein PFLUO_LOCUS4367 [Penicillium psychrofluorescens]|uniref:uncharacterized protein n=1 Tax=Penicillium psychrofluorescens TaxID=3158075 RepID=UPI003CCD468D